MNIKLYLDFDGVILNTIDITYTMFKEKNITNPEEIVDFYRNLDWNEIIKVSEPINDSINRIKDIINSDLYDVSILSHVVTIEEANGKREFLNKNLPGINLIAVDRDKNKCDVVDCKNAILVDDYMGNLELWHKKGGIPIKFSDKGKEYDFMSISDLGMLITKYDEIKELIINNSKLNVVNFKK